ncbi:MAG: copper amine oxidase N-terminal domain-containing protein [Defluviitaleaceae bacterium]|nr:copper amine oxidase N-terminal domain-containing protein [Defluviitaleaceae bacterium]
MKHKLVKRVLTLVLGFAMAFALFAPASVSAATVEIYRLSADEGIQGSDLGAITLGDVTDYVTNAGPPATSIIETPDGTKGIQVSNRRANWHSLDVLLGNMDMDIATNTYSIRIVGSVASGSGEVVLGGHQSPWGRIHTANTGEGGSFTIEGDISISNLRPAGTAADNYNVFRVRLNAVGELDLVDINVYEILITREGGEAAEEEVEEEIEEEEAEEEEVVEEEEEEVYVPIVPIIEEVVPTGVTIQLTIDSTNMVVNGVSQTLEAAPFIDVAANRTMVPFRAIGYAMGAVVDFDAATRTASYVLDGRTLQLVIGEELPGGMGTPEVVDGRTLVPVRFVTEFFGAELQVALPNITITLGDAPAPVAQAPTAPAAGENSPGIIIAQAEFTSDPLWGDSWDGTSGAVVVIGQGEGTWPHAAGTAEGYRAFEPVAGNTYRVSFNVTNHGSGGWRVRWTRNTQLFNYNTAGDYAIVNDHPFAPSAVANIIPAHFNQGVSADGTYTLVVDITLDGSQGYDELIGNIALTGTGGSHAYVVNWVSVERDGAVIASWSAD